MTDDMFVRPDDPLAVGALNARREQQKASAVRALQGAKTSYLLLVAVPGDDDCFTVESHGAAGGHPHHALEETFEIAAAAVAACQETATRLAAVITQLMNGADDE